jgi:septal ring factor EnvC (AmiA/AmiB activator)
MTEINRSAHTDVHAMEHKKQVENNKMEVKRIQHEIDAINARSIPLVHNIEKKEAELERTKSELEKIKRDYDRDTQELHRLNEEKIHLDTQKLNLEKRKSQYPIV